MTANPEVQGRTMQPTVVTPSTDGKRRKRLEMILDTTITSSRREGIPIFEKIEMNNWA